MTVEQNRDLYDIMGPALILGKDNRIIYGNPAFYALTGLSPRHLRKNPELSEIIDSPEIAELVSSCWESQRLCKSREVEIRPLKGASLSVVGQALIKNEELLLTFQDFTVERQLQNKYKEKVEGLKSAYKKLEESKGSEALAAMAAGICHEIGSPITMMSSELYLLLQNCDGEVKEGLERLSVQLNNVEKIVKNTRRMSHKREFSHWQIVLPNIFFEGSVKQIIEHWKGRGISVEIEHEGTELIWCDILKMEQVLVNLVKNSAEALGKSPDPKINIKTISSEGNVKIIVQDNGPGVPQDLRQKIFEPFFTTKDVESGSGLGLSLCRKLMQEVWGTLELEESDSGAKFVMELPTSSNAVLIALAQNMATSEGLRPVLLYSTDVNWINKTIESLGELGESPFPVMKAEHLEEAFQMEGSKAIIADHKLSPDVIKIKGELPLKETKNIEELKRFLKEI